MNTNENNTAESMLAKPVLVIDNNVDMTSLIMHFLAKRRFQNVCKIENFSDAKRQITDCPENFSLVVIELELGADNGLETIGLIRRTSPETKIIAMIGTRNARLIMIARNAGLDAVLIKPEIWEDFNSALDHIICRAEELTPVP